MAINATNAQRQSDALKRREYARQLRAEHDAAMREYLHAAVALACARAVSPDLWVVVQDAAFRMEACWQALIGKTRATELRRDQAIGELWRQRRLAGYPLFENTGRRPRPSCR